MLLDGLKGEGMSVVGYYLPYLTTVQYTGHVHILWWCYLYVHLFLSYLEVLGLAAYHYFCVRIYPHIICTLLLLCSTRVVYL